MDWFLYDDGLRLERVDYLKIEKLREKIRKLSPFREQ